MDSKSSFLSLIFLLLTISCKDTREIQLDKTEIDLKQKLFSKIIEENYDILNDSISFSSGTIENFDKSGKSINVFWINEEMDTILRFYRKYDKNKTLIGAEYFEEGDEEPSKDTVFTNSNGLKV
ncbi:MAG: hypothetical protein AAF901_02965, partial [Bacteroidota bacterium]